MKIVDGVLRNVEPKDIVAGTLTLPKGVRYIDEESFSQIKNISSSKLKKVIISDGVEEIGAKAFKDIKSLKVCVIPPSCKTIGIEAFSETKIKKIDISNVTSIKNMAFDKCKSLKVVKLGEELSAIGDCAFSNCVKLSKINFPDSLKFIGSYAFDNCASLRIVSFPKNLETIEYGAFANSAIREVVLGEKVEIIKENTFSCCNHLTLVDMPGVKKIESLAFGYSPKIKIINVPKAEKIEKANFEYLKNVSKFILKADCETNCKILCKYMKKEGGIFYLSNNPIENGHNAREYKELNIEIANLLWNTKYLKECRQKHVGEMYGFIKNQVFKEKEDFLAFVKDKNINFFKNLKLPMDKYSFVNRLNFYKLYYNLGGFMKPVEEVRTTKKGHKITKEVDYAQMVGEFLKERIAAKELQLNIKQDMFSGMGLNGFNPEFTRFFLDKNNFRELIDAEKNNPGFIARCYNEFYDVQRTNTSNRGEQRQLKPTIKKFKEYFADVLFRGVTKENIAIAKRISGYFARQATFDRAIKIDDERRANNTPNNILSAHLKEYDVFEEIEKLKNEIEKSSADTLGILTELSNKKFTYDWLEKNDPSNFILGKLCSCCAHIEGVGFGIMRASIIHPDVQNLVIRDKNQWIIAKSTLYVNRKEGYGVFNNIEINRNVKNSDKKDIYNKIMEAVKAFAEAYNKENPENPLKKLTVGMNFNDLESIIKHNNKRSQRIEMALHYGGFDYQSNGYIGDSHYEQYVLWEKD